VRLTSSRLRAAVPRPQSAASRSHPDDQPRAHLVDSLGIAHVRRAPTRRRTRFLRRSASVNDAAFDPDWPADRHGEQGRHRADRRRESSERAAGDPSSSAPRRGHASPATGTACSLFRGTARPHLRRTNGQARTVACCLRSPLGRATASARAREAVPSQIGKEATRSVWRWRRRAGAAQPAAGRGRRRWLASRSREGSALLRRCDPTTHGGCGSSIHAPAFGRDLRPLAGRAASPSALAAVRRDRRNRNGLHLGHRPGASAEPPVLEARGRNLRCRVRPFEANVLTASDDGSARLWRAGHGRAARRLSRRPGGQGTVLAERKVIVTTTVWRHARPGRGCGAGAAARRSVTCTEPPSRSDHFRPLMERHLVAVGSPAPGPLETGSGTSSTLLLRSLPGSIFWSVLTARLIAYGRGVRAVTAAALAPAVEREVQQGFGPARPSLTAGCARRPGRGPVRRRLHPRPRSRGVPHRLHAQGDVARRWQ
jgi:hypothetical protein